MVSQGQLIMKGTWQQAGRHGTVLEWQLIPLHLDPQAGLQRKVGHWAWYGHVKSQIPLPVIHLLQQGHAFYPSKEFFTWGLKMPVYEPVGLFSFKPPQALGVQCSFQTLKFVITASICTDVSGGMYGSQTATLWSFLLLGIHLWSPDLLSQVPLTH